MAATFTRLGIGYFGALRLLMTSKPRAVIGFGGYPTLPPIIAARTSGIPTAIHEQMPCMGRANRLLSRVVDRVALSFKPTKLLHADAEAKSRLTGTPVRDAVLSYRDTPYQPPEPGGRLLLLVFGGSQGARFFSEATPPALERLPAEMRERLTVVQQAREERHRGSAPGLREGRDRRAHRALLPRPARAIRRRASRRGAGRRLDRRRADGDRQAVFLVPLPHVLDNDQLENAKRLQEGGGGWCVRQQESDPERLAGETHRLFSSPEVLAVAAAKGRAMAETEAVRKLADLRPGGPARTKAE